MFKGTVIHGDGLGKKYGYPTANLNIKKKALNLPSGVYAGLAVLKGKRYKAAVIIKEKTGMEVHLLNYRGGNFYGDSLAVEVGEKVNKVKIYSSTKELVKKIKADIKKIKLSL